MQTLSLLRKAINEDEDIEGILTASKASGSGSILLTPDGGFPFVAAVSAKNGENNISDDNEASYSNIFTPSTLDITITNNNGTIEVTERQKQ